jgi:hypothetical protein
MRNESTHSVPKGPTLIQRIERQMDKRREKLEQKRIDQGYATKPLSPQSYEYAMWEQALEQGRYEGLSAAIAIMRSSSVPEEVSRSNERLNIE